MVDVLEERVVKTRKQHQCHGCRTMIPAGQPAEVAVCAEGGELSRTYTCQTCMIMLADPVIAHTIIDDGEIWEGSVRESANDYFAGIWDATRAAAEEACER